MKTSKKHIVKQRGLRTILVLSGLVFTYAVTIPANLGNAVQYIMQTVWTDDWSDSGLVNVAIDDTNIYVRTGFLADGTGWNNRALWVDSSWNVVYVDANGMNNLYNLPTANYIPKVNNGQNGFDVSTMYQTWWLIWVNTTNPVKSLDIFGDFQVTTLGNNVQYQYNYYNSNTGVWYPAVDITIAPRCTICDNDPGDLDCWGWGSFIAPTDYGTYCIDATSRVNGNEYDHDVYFRQIIWIPDPVLVTSGNRVWIRTTNPITDLHVSWSGYALIETWTITKNLSILDDTISFQGAIGWLEFRTYNSIKKLVLSTFNNNGLPDILINPNRWCVLWRNNNCIRNIPAPKVGIWLDNPAEMLEVAWLVRSDGIILTSDETLKTGINSLSGSLDKLLNIQWVSYTRIQEEIVWSSEWDSSIPDPSIENNRNIDTLLSKDPIKPKPTELQIGFLAQNIQEEFPELVAENNDWVLWINYNWIIPVLVEAVKEQQDIIDDLMTRIEALEG